MLKARGCAPGRRSQRRRGRGRRRWRGGCRRRRSGRRSRGSAEGSGGFAGWPCLSPVSSLPVQRACCRHTSLIRKRPPLGTYSRTMHRAPWWSLAGGLFRMSKVPLHRRTLELVLQDCPAVSLSSSLPALKSCYRDTSLIRKRLPLGTYSRPTPTALWRSWRSGSFL